MFDGLERVIGTSTSHADSDGDGALDHEEYPFATVPVSDPCGGPNVVCPRGADAIFKNGFE